jgi:hypothetical protein
MKFGSLRLWRLCNTKIVCLSFSKAMTCYFNVRVESILQLSKTELGLLKKVIISGPKYESIVT